MNTDITKEVAGQSVELQKLITSAFNDVVTANAIAAMRQTELMLENCFTKKGDEYSPIMIKMTLERSVITPGATPDQPTTAQSFTTHFNLPLLTIIPLNALAFDTVNIEFDLDITAAKSSFKAETGEEHTSIFVNANKAPEADSTESTTNRLKISVNAAKLPLPKGVAVLIDAFANVITPVVSTANQ